MENVKFNRCQTSLEELHLEKYPQEVQDQFWDFLNNVPFIKWMVSPDRPLISELPRDKEEIELLFIILKYISYIVDKFRGIKNENGLPITNLRPLCNYYYFMKMFIIFSMFIFLVFVIYSTSQSQLLSKESDQ